MDSTDENISIAINSGLSLPTVLVTSSHAIAIGEGLILNTPRALKFGDRENNVTVSNDGMEIVGDFNVALEVLKTSLFKICKTTAEPSPFAWH